MLILAKDEPFVRFPSPPKILMYSSTKCGFFDCNFFLLANKDVLYQSLDEFVEETEPVDY